jgi:hypothetical protein
MMFNKSRVLASSLLAVSAAVLVACGGDVAPTPVAAANTVVTANPANSAAATTLLQAAPATFSGAVPALGTTAATTVTVSTTTATYTPPGGTAVTGPAFTIASAGATAKGVLTFGSCVFTVSESSFPADHPLAVGKQVVVNPCQATLGTSGTVADGAPKSTSLNLTLGTTTSAASTVTTVVSTTGSVSLVSSSGATVPVGTVVTVTPTGTGTGGG